MGDGADHASETDEFYADARRARHLHYQSTRPAGLDTGLEQTKWWTTREGVRIKLTMMEPRHRHNLIQWLERNASGIREAQLYRMAMHDFEDGSGAADGIEALIEQMTDGDPLEWMKARPLYRRLVKLQKKVRYEPDPPVEYEPARHEEVTWTE